MTQQAIAIEWRNGRPKGRVTVTDGRLLDLRVARGEGSVENGQFSSSADSPFRLSVSVSGSDVQYGPGSTIVSVEAEHGAFSFFLRDVNRQAPIWIPQVDVTVTTGDDLRSYSEIEHDILQRELRTRLQQIEHEPEESFACAAESTRSLKCPTWLGLGRDMRIFSVGERLEWILPQFHGLEVPLPETQDRPCRYDFQMGRGWGPADQIERSLDRGILPILKGTLVDDDIRYDLTAFVWTESKTALRGTHFLVADGHSRGHMFTEPQRCQYESLRPEEMNRDDETVLYLRVTATNTSPALRYAFFRNPAPTVLVTVPVMGIIDAPPPEWSFDGARGFGVYPSGRVFCVSKFNGNPLPHEEVTPLLPPGGTATFEAYLPHRPISDRRAAALSAASFDDRVQECREFWNHKLETAAKIAVPEKRINEMIQAGLLHLDLVTYGLEPEGTLAATIGVYCPIGSESAPIIQFMDSMGWHDIARRSLMYFLEKQHEDGFMQNFGGFMLETGAALWCIGEHYRYTRDQQWIEQIAPQLVKSCEFLLNWRQRNLREDLRGKGYGMIEGKVADPEDPFRSFMLNGYAYLGLHRMGEVFAEIDASAASRFQTEAEALKEDIRNALVEVMGKSPVVPLGDGAWCPTAPPWAEYRGPLLLHAQGGRWFTHGGIASRDSMLGPLYLVYQEVLDPSELAATSLLNFHCELMTKRNVAFSQPYYSRHPIVHLRRGETKAFLKAYYNTMASLADRETYTFWEHYFLASPHKTHEEAWFLMETRWMLYVERDETLALLQGIPRTYLENGKRIELNRAASYFGSFSLQVESKLDEGRIEATMECTSDRRPKRIELRLPHPEGLRAARVEGGAYNPERESVEIESFHGHAEVVLVFGMQD
jgi:hypothetical protein